MERWNRLNVYFSLVGLLIFIVSLIFMKKMPLLLLLAMFGLGIMFKSFKNIYKKEEPPKANAGRSSYYAKAEKKKKK